MAEKGLNCGINKTLIMATKITVPDIGDFENVEIIEILTKPGTIIKKNDPIVTLESDKSSVEVPSPFSGKISSLEVKIGDKVSKGSVLAIIEDEKNVRQLKHFQGIAQAKAAKELAEAEAFAAQLADVKHGSEVKEIILKLNHHYDSRGQSFRIEKIAGGYRFMTKQNYSTVTDFARLRG